MLLLAAVHAADEMARGILFTCAPEPPRGPRGLSAASRTPSTPFSCADACPALCSCAAVFMALDWHWTGCFLNRVSAPSCATAVLAGMVRPSRADPSNPSGARRPPCPCARSE